MRCKELCRCGVVEGRHDPTHMLQTRYCNGSKKGSARISHAGCITDIGRGTCAKRRAEPFLGWLSLCGCEGNRRLRRPVKGAPLRGRAKLALDRPTRRFWDGYKEMG